MHHQKVYLYICIKIRKEQKNLYKEIVPKAVDEYLDCIEKSKKQNELTVINESSLACS